MKKLLGIRRLRLEKGLRQRELAKLLGMSQGTLSLIESGQRDLSQEERSSFMRALGLEKK